VSRKHLVLEVKPIESGAGTRIHEKSALTITDDSKLGSTLDGESFKKETKTLKGNEHVIRLGRFESEFKIRWRPVVLTVTSLNKTQKSAADPLFSAREKLEKYDIKLSLEYIPNVTTHVVATKRNILPTLCALIEGRHVVIDSFVDALAEACASQPNHADPQNPLRSPLEQDFVSNWPVEAEYLPPPGKEPVTRGPEYFSPNPQRSNVFEGYTFVFVDPNQFEFLQPIITVGGGKAVVYERFQKNASRPEEFVEFTKQKNHGAWKPGQGKGPVVVRFEIKPDDQWGHQFCNDADIALRQRSIKQNEFLDAILLNDATKLRRPLEETTEPPSSTAPAQLSSTTSRVGSRSAIGTSSVPPPPSQSSVAPPREPEQTAAALQQTATTLPPRRQRRAITESRFKGFDDFDTSAVPPRRAPVQDSDDELSDDNFASEVPEPSQPSRQPHTQGKKRPAPPSDDEISNDAPARTKRTRRHGDGDEEMGDAEDVVDQLLPAAAAMRRKKTNTQVGGENGSAAVHHEKTEKELAREREKARLERARRKRDRNAEINVEEEVRKRRRREIEEAEAEEERVRRGLEGVDVGGLRDLVEIEEMEAPSRLMERVSRDDAREGSESRNGREWREEWNGRKNFKGFRPKRTKGESRGQNEPPRQRIIVALEEVKKKSFGIGEEYWGESRSDGKKSQESRKTSQVESQRVRATQRDDEEGDDRQFRRSKKSKSQSSAAKSQSQRTAKSASRSAVVAESDDDEQLPDDPMAVQHPEEREEVMLPPQTDHSLRSRVTETQISKAAGSPETQRKGKRPAKESVGSEPPSKKGRRKKVESEEDSDEDGLKFRRKRK
jgi:hypothetical protein